MIIDTLEQSLSHIIYSMYICVHQVVIVIDTSVSMKENFQLIKDSLALLFQVAIKCKMFLLSDNCCVIMLLMECVSRMPMNTNDHYSLSVTYDAAVHSCILMCS